MGKEPEHYLRRELYELVRSDEAAFDFLERGSLDGVWYWDLDNPDHEWMSPRFWEVFGHDPALKKHLASEWQDMIDQDDLAVALGNFERHCADPSHPYDQVVRYRHADGGTVWVRCRGMVIRDEAGRPVRMLGAHNEVTALMRQTQELEAARERLEAAMAGGRVAMLEVVFGEPAEVWWSSSLVSVLGVMLREGPPSIDLLLAAVHPDDVDDVRAAFADLRKPASEVTRQFRARTPRGYRWLELRANSSAAGDVCRARGTLVDIDTSKTLEERLSRSNAELEQFAYVASHDLREPLRTVASFTQLLRAECGGKLGDSADRYIDFAVDGAKRMQALIDGLLELSRVAPDALVLECVDCGALVRRVLGVLQPDVQAAGATVAVGALPNVAGDTVLLGQVFQNLLANALKFHGDDPPAIRIHAAEQTDGVWRFSVSDNGIGIDPKHAARIFEVFQRLHRRDDYPGTGLGLAMVKKIVERHGGRVWVEGEPGEGATFFFTLPPAPVEGM